MKNRIIAAVTVATFTWMFLAIPAEARTVVRSGETVSVAEDQAIEGDFYSAANIVNISGQITEDMVSAGADVTINGSVGDDVLIVAGRSDVHGSVGDDLRIISGEATIAEPVTGDVFVIGGVVNILSTASIGGDLIVYAGQATIEGLVEGDVIGTVEELRIDSAVNGNIDVTVAKLTLGDRANIAGNVKYVSHDVVVQSLNAIVGGELVRNDPILPGKDTGLKAALVPVLILLFSVLVWYLISRKTLNLVVDRALLRSPRPFLIGVGVMLFTPLAAGLLLVSMVGVLAGIVLWIAYLLLILLGVIGFSAVLGKLLMTLFNKPKASLSLFTLVIGVLGTILLILLPVIGIFAVIVLILLTIGAMVDLLIKPILK